MEQYVDLHTHSTASDGTMAPMELIRHAKKRGLKGVAITDHDMISGIEEAMAEAKKVGIDFIPGVETSADFDTNMHILGYFHEKNYMSIKPLLEKIIPLRSKKNYYVMEKLKEAGITITWEDVLKFTSGELPMKIHFINALMMKGIVKTEQEANEKYFNKGGLAYCVEEKLTPERIITEIVKAGGVPVLAHPVLIGLSMQNLDNLIGERLKKVGLMGIEAIYSDHSPEQTEKLTAIAKKHDLLITGGSDFHGGNKEGCEIGIGRGNLKISYQVFEQLKSKIKNQLN